MKRFHVHIAVDNLAANIDFYSKLFGQRPSKHKADYAKWMLDDPRINFAISSRGAASGVDHFGMQAEHPEELSALEAHARDASADALFDQGEAACCYARSEKHWVVDPQGIAWEHFLSMADTETFGGGRLAKTGDCCAPRSVSAAADAPTEAGCCASEATTAAGGSCCG
ncbi:glyoxalase/bleomycin resistance/dioxygenase family protein [Denitromonas ohlonensis]|uniref:Glyoxalase/bleomycin resistance/dioxygenase family protein n=3 Tax=Denitromonas TaxID=139331 RepID=A0A557SBL9_9RHOO|nr:glyoxalase/bleomycin resistance/dioxygenase family protein [Denitromonas ohlonensis]TVO74816.1 glyoxalase/bleomycin resistance/dioxygenase family protein [Denitromonas ohlonensis]